MKETQILRNRIMDLEAVLHEAGTKFREYEQLHKAKEPPDLNKAQANAVMASMCETVLNNKV